MQTIRRSRTPDRGLDSGIEIRIGAGKEGTRRTDEAQRTDIVCVCKTVKPLIITSGGAAPFISTTFLVPFSSFFFLADQKSRNPKPQKKSPHLSVKISGNGRPTISSGTGQLTCSRGINNHPHRPPSDRFLLRFCIFYHRLLKFESQVFNSLTRSHCFTLYSTTLIVQDPFRETQTSRTSFLLCFLECAVLVLIALKLTLKLLSLSNGNNRGQP
jgi:hypothetical protein